MYQRIMEILILLMDELGGSSSSLDEMDQLSDDLIERGYTEQEINTAFYWLYNRFQKESTPLYHKFDITPPEESAHRVLHTLEHRYVSPAAFGFLIQLQHLNLITSLELEEVIDRATALGLQSASVEDVRMILQTILFEDNGFWAGTLRAYGIHRDDETYH
ncbi:DUF494 domain-containing protein [bacterium]|nr:DUF494 domain-containing protein [bacterium]MBU1651985.1 DUF494 domain-containing protein [bacterium]